MRAIISILSAILLFYVFTKVGIDYSFSDLENYLQVLLIVSSMVFTIMGIWIAFLYPNALQRLTKTEVIKNADFSETRSDTKRLEGLVGTVLKSVIVVISIMFFYLTKLVLSGIEFDTAFNNTIKSAALSFAVLLSYLQIEALIYVGYSNIMFLNDLHYKRESREEDQDV